VTVSSRGPDRLAILDRDGTLIDVVRDEETGVITTAFHPNQIRLLDGVIEGLLHLRNSGYALALATNQPGPAKGHFSRDAVIRTNAALVALLAEQGIELGHVGVCMHHPKGGPGGDVQLIGKCACRKPRPGMLIDAMNALGFERKVTWMVGDGMADVDAAHAAGVRSALLFADNRCELCPLRQGPSVLPSVHAATFAELAHAIVDADKAQNARQGAATDDLP
jgi:D-glycero-D-manno-heptose 1,7-bisphosphate phosphatase